MYLKFSFYHFFSIAVIFVFRNSTDIEISFHTANCTNQMAWQVLTTFKLTCEKCEKRRLNFDFNER